VSGATGRKPGAHDTDHQGPDRIGREIATVSGDLRSDRELVAAVVAGDMQTLGEIYRRYGRLVLSVVARKLGPRDAADIEDLAHDVLLTFADRASGCREPDKLKSYLCGIAHFKAREVVRNRSWRQRLLERFSSRTHALDPYGPLLARDELIQALSRLPENQREALILFEVEGLPVTEVAEILGVAVNTVWTRIHRARQTLLKAVQADLAHSHGGEP